MPAGKGKGQAKAAIMAEAEVLMWVGGSGLRGPSQDSCGTAGDTLALLTQFLSAE